MKKFLTVLLASALVAIAIVSAGFKVATAEEPLVDNAKAAVLIDAETGTVITEKNTTERLQIASMVKIMTLNIAFEEIEAGRLSYDDDVTASEYATSMGGSQAFLDTGATYKAGELIKSIVVASANDSCVAIAEHIAGSVPAFVERMNENAKVWGMENTNFVNCTGLPAPNEYSSAADVSVMFRKLVGHKDFYVFAKVWMFDFVHPSGRVTELSNTNKLVRFYEGCDGGKTGFTSEALSCLAATAKRGDTRLICVVVGAPDSKTRNAQVCGLFNYGFSGFESKKFVCAGDKIDGSATVDGGKVGEVGGFAEDDLAVFGKKGTNKCEIQTEFYSVAAPVKRGDIIGTVKVVRDGETVASCNILASEDVETKTYGDVVGDFIKKW